MRILRAKMESVPRSLGDSHRDAWRGRHAIPKLVVVSLAALVLLSAAPGTRGQFGGTLTITGVDVSARDTDGSGAFDVFVVNVSVDVSREGWFEFSMTVRIPTPWMSYISVDNGTDLNLTLGPHTVSMSVPAALVGTFRVSGPFLVQVLVYALTPNLYTSFVATQTTDSPAWTASEFDGPSVTFGGPITDEGRDLQRDGQYDQLVVHVPLRVLRRTTVDVLGYILGRFRLSVLADAQPSRILDVGAYTWDIVFEGTTLYVLGQASPYGLSSPYNVSVFLTTGGFAWASLINYTFHVTGPYAYTDFERPSADFAGTPSMSPVDTNGNGKADVLEVHVPLHVRESGDFEVWASVTCSAPCTDSLALERKRDLHLDRGDPTVELSLSGQALGQLAPGSVTAIQVTVARLDLPTPLRLDENSTSLPFVTFDPTVFESRPVADLIVHVLGGATDPMCGYATALDPATGYGADWDSAIPPTFPHLSLYNGTFDVLVSSCSPLLGASVVQVAVSGVTALNVTLPPMARFRTDVNLSLSNWTGASLDAAFDWGATSPYPRFWADLDGNRDGEADVGELTHYAMGFLGFYVAGGSYRSVPDFYVHVDAATLYPKDVGWPESEGAGALTGSGSVILRAHSDLEALAPVNATARHTLTLDEPFGSSSNNHVRVVLPQGADGNLSVTAHVLMSFQGFDFPGNATVLKTGAGAWDVALGGLSANLTYGSVPRITIVAVQSPSLTAAVLTLTLIAIAAVPIVVVILLLRRRGRRGGKLADAKPPAP